MDVDGVDMLDDHLSGYEFLDRLVSTRSSAPKSTLTRRCVGPLLDETVLRGVGGEEHRDDEDPEAQDAVYGIPDRDGGVPGLGERAGTSSFPLTVWRVQTLLSTDYRPPLTWRPNQARFSSQMPKSNSGASGAAISSSTSASLLRWGSSLRRSGGN